MEKDNEYRINRSGASVFLGDAMAVQKVLTVKKNCSSVKHDFQLDGEEEPPKGVVLLSEALQKAPGTLPTRAPTGYQRPQLDILHERNYWFS